MVFCSSAVPPETAIPSGVGVRSSLLKFSTIVEFRIRVVPNVNSPPGEATLPRLRATVLLISVRSPPEFTRPLPKSTRGPLSMMAELLIVTVPPSIPNAPPHLRHFRQACSGGWSLNRHRYTHPRPHAARGSV